MSQTARSDPKSPCFGCMNRFPGCHDRCLEYIDFRQKRDVFLETVKENKRLSKLVKYSGLSYAERSKMTDTQKMAIKARPERPSQRI